MRFRFRYIENILLYLNGGVLINIYKQNNTVYCLSHLYGRRGCTNAFLKTELVIFHIFNSYFIHIQNMASKKQTSPVFAENMLYKIWKNKIDIRKLVTSVEAKEQGIFALLDSLDGNAKTEKAVSELTAA